MQDDTSCRLKLPHDQATLLWKITGKCNLRCRHCLSIRGWHSNRKTLFSCVKDLHKRDIRRVVLTGGEPMFHPDLVDLIRVLHSEEIKVVLLTNGTGLTQRLMEQLLRVGLMSVTVSLYSHKAATNDQIVGKSGAWQTARSALEVCKDVSLAFGISTTVLLQNETDIGPLIDFAFEHRATHVSVNSFLPHPCAEKGLVDWYNSWSPESIATTVIAKRRRWGGDNRIRTSGIFPASKDFQCPAGLTFFGLLETGQWVDCLSAAAFGFMRRSELEQACNPTECILMRCKGTGLPNFSSPVAHKHYLLSQRGQAK